MVGLAEMRGKLNPRRLGLRRHFIILKLTTWLFGIGDGDGEKLDTGLFDVDFVTFWGDFYGLGDQERFLEAAEDGVIAEF